MAEIKSTTENTDKQNTTANDTKDNKETIEVIKKFYCKLYLFRDPEWTERGVGDIKFYTNKDGLICMIHNREKTGLISLHQVVSETSTLAKRDDIKHCYSWTAADNSDNDDEKVEILTFAIRFKTEEIANEFKELFEKSKKDNKAKSNTKPAKKIDSSKTDTQAENKEEKNDSNSDVNNKTSAVVDKEKKD
eukprot:GAHX01000993.1.p1 GENE.GAHX01000993.1~~GAHX01000993.1.p1  ORF type:complete len:202 (+),score=68.38 GAHX01000993.1:34-606(+)